MTTMATWNGTVLAESDKSTTCPWMGRAGYYTVAADGERIGVLRRLFGAAAGAERS